MSSEMAPLWKQQTKPFPRKVTCSTCHHVRYYIAFFASQMFPRFPFFSVTDYLHIFFEDIDGAKSMDACFLEDHCEDLMPKWLPHWQLPRPEHPVRGELQSYPSRRTTWNCSLAAKKVSQHYKMAKTTRRPTTLAMLLCLVRENTTFSGS